MKPSESSSKLYSVINKAIEDLKITRSEYEMITHISSEDGHIDPQEKILLEQLHEMIHSGMIKMVKE